MLTVRRRCGAATVRISFTERDDAPPGALGLTLLRQVHGARVLRVTQPGEHCGAEADASWTTCAGATLAIRTADCVPLALYGLDDRGGAAVAAVHAGWRGLLDGVVGAALREIAAAGFSQMRAVVGPHVSAAQYEFGAPELARVVDALGPSVAATTAWGTDALDLAEATRIALNRASAELDFELGHCTASDIRYFSHRASGDTERTMMLVTLEPTSESNDVPDD